MSTDPSDNRSTSTSTPSTNGWRPRHIWFPLVVVAGVAGWLVWQIAPTGYHTFYHITTGLIGALLVSFWFATSAGLSRRTGWTVVGLFWLVLAILFACFRPIYNGDMGIAGWRLRFGRAADERLERAAADGRADDWQTSPRDYPKFLGNGHWAEVPGVRLATDWETRPPQDVWRREIGAGWSAFAVVGPYAVTQEQRGEEELVTCYRVADGSLVWTHADAVRFDPADAGGLGGIGPRATPTIVGERIFTQGATGVVNCLDARTGKAIWSHDTISETGAPLPLWGKSGSPLVVDDIVVVSVGAPGASLIAYDLETGAVRWKGGDRKASYATPVLATLAGMRQILVVNEGYITAHEPAGGRVLWERPWPDEPDSTASCSQPLPLAGDRLFISKGYGVGASLFQITRDDGGVLAARPLWNPPLQRTMKTKFSNVVVRDGYVYGLDDVILSCIELETGRTKWKARRRPAFGHGQLMLVGDALLVLSESGELVLVEASPNAYRELARLQALDAGNITWNNPAFAPPHLLIRNASEAACYRLPLAE